MIEAKKRLVSNVVSSALAVIVNSVVAIWQTPYLIRHLGVEVYGMIPLVTSFIAYMNLFTTALSSAVSRYVAIYAGRGETETGNRYLSSAATVLLIICALLLVPVLVMAVNFARVFHVPSGQERSSGWLFLFVMLAGGALALASPYQVSTFVRHRFDLSNAVTIGTKGVLVAAIVVFFTWVSPSLAYFGVAYSLMAMALLAASMVLTHILTPEFRIDVRKFDFGAVKDMGRMSGWIAVNQLGAVLYISFGFIVINLFLGPEAVGRYGPVAQLSVLLSTLGGALSNVFAPIAFEYIARNQLQDLVLQLQRAIKLLGLAMGFAVGVLCGMATPILKRWLGPEFVDLTPLVWLLIGPWLASIAVRPAFAVFRGLDKVKVPGLVTCAGGIVNVCLSIVLIRFTGLGIYGVAWALLVCLAGKNLLFTPVYTSLIMGVSKMVFIRSLLPGTVMALLLTLAGLVLSRVYHLATIPRLLGVTVMLLPIYAITCYSVFMTCEERRLVWSVLLRKELSRV